MRTRPLKSGLTLTELLVTVAIAAVLMAVAVPAAKRISRSLGEAAGTRGIVSAALSNARAIAVRSGKDAGLRFQRAADGRTYIVYIIYDYEATGLANGFRALEGRKPILLPEGLKIEGPIDEFWDTTFSVVFSPAGKLVLRWIRLDGDGFDRSSVNRFRILDADGIFTDLMVSPYTGELIGE